jgi:short-subunit dehydrogenase
MVLIGVIRMGFRGQTVVITGASSGIGEALAVELGAQGAKVGLIARRADRLEQITSKIRSAGGTVATATADVGDREQVFTAIAKLETELGPADLMIANAGASDYTGADPMNVPGVELMMRVNFLGVVYAFEAVLPKMLARGKGHLAAVSSLAAYKGLPGSAGYCASKAAVSSYCEGLRIELAPRGVAVTTICPGFIRTDMTAKNVQPMPFMLEPDAAAKRILGALRRRKKVFNFPWVMYRLMRATRFMPDRMIRKRLMGGPAKPVG